jgi:hypothetical protein
MNAITKEEFFANGLAEGKTFGALQKEWKESGFAASKKRGFRAAFYEALKSGAITDMTEAYEFRDDPANGASENDIKQFSHYEGIAELVFAVRSDLE